eukprot:89249-Chlamydomonas_euryale.AAC.6
MAVPRVPPGAATLMPQLPAHRNASVPDASGALPKHAGGALALPKHGTAAAALRASSPHVESSAIADASCTKASTPWWQEGEVG